MIVLDTNIVSELMRPRPDAGVRDWVRRQEPGSLRTTAITIAEIRFGLARLPSGRRRRELEAAFGEVTASFEDSCLSFDLEAAQRYGAIASDRERAGRPIAALDAQIAAICITHQATLATRNRADFDDLGLRLIDPFNLETEARSAER